MTEIKSTLSDTAVKVAADALQGALVDLLDASLLAKQAHWNVVGPQFRSLHLQLDELVALAREHADSVAERAVAIGANPDGRPATIAQGSRAAQPAPGYIEDTKVVLVITEMLNSIIERFRVRIGETGELDVVTQDLLIGITRDLEMQHWMFQAQTR